MRGDNNTDVCLSETFTKYLKTRMKTVKLTQQDTAGLYDNLHCKGTAFNSRINKDTDTNTNTNKDIEKTVKSNSLLSRLYDCFSTPFAKKEQEKVNLDIRTIQEEIQTDLREHLLMNQSQEF